MNFFASPVISGALRILKILSTWSVLSLKYLMQSAYSCDVVPANVQFIRKKNEQALLLQSEILHCSFLSLNLYLQFHFPQNSI